MEEQGQEAHRRAHRSALVPLLLCWVQGSVLYL